MCENTLDCFLRFYPSQALLIASGPLFLLALDPGTGEPRLLFELPMGDTPRELSCDRNNMKVTAPVPNP